MPDLIIEDGTSNDILFPPQHRMDLVARDYAKDPAEMFAAPDSLKLIPRTDWDAILEEQEREQSSLEHIRNRAANGKMMPCLDQNGFNYCWAHSVTHTVMLSRSVASQPYLLLSAVGLASVIQNGANEGGWCGLAAKRAREFGIPSQKFWPQSSLSLSHNTPETQADALKNKITENLVDLTRNVWEQNLSFDAVATCLLKRIPVATDWNFWSHSVMAMRLVRIEAGSYGLKILNNWYISPGVMWGDNGTAVIRESKSAPDGAIATLTTSAA